MRTVHSILDLIGETPVFKYPLHRGQLFLKLESNNPTHSMKDRMAFHMVEAAERQGVLHPGGTIIESSSGNTATSLAMIAAVKGYAFIAVVDDHCAKEKILHIEAFGGRVLQIQSTQKGLPSPNEREAVARRLANELPNAFWTNQADNPANAAGYALLAQELTGQVPKLDTVIGAVGTGGSLSGTSRELRSLGKKIQVIGVEPAGSTYFSAKGHHYFQSGTGNPPGATLPRNFDSSQINGHRQVTDSAAFTTCSFLAAHLGLLVGGSSGGLVYTALRFAADNSGCNIAVILPDAGEKYLDTIFSKSWIHEHHLFNQSVWDELASLTKTVRQPSATAPHLVAPDQTL